MPRATWFAIATLSSVVYLLNSCGKSDSGATGPKLAKKDADAEVLNIYNWADFIAPDTISSFEKETGIKVNVSYFDSNDTLETRMLTGHSGFDIVFPSDTYFQREIRSGAYLALDKAQLPNLSHLDPALMARATSYDPGSAHGIVYMWGTVGIGYNESRVAAALPNVPVNSWRLLFDPTLAKKLAPCGINVINEPAVVVGIALKYLGKDPSAPSPQDFVDVEKLLLSIRPFIRTFDTSGDIEAMVNGEICISLGYSGDVVLANNRAREAKKPIKVAYVIPAEGSMLWFTLTAIPRDAPHAANAHMFLNYLMNPQVIANISNFIAYANPNADAVPLLDAKIATNTIIYPTRDEQKRLFVDTDYSPEQSRAITRLWQKFKTGQ